jgi:hypothetical protein
MRPSSLQAQSRRQGVILLVVVMLLTLFAAVGLTFVLYAEREANAARIFREAETMTEPDFDPPFLLAFFLGQLLYDLPDDPHGACSALRGHSLARLTFGYNDDLPDGNRTPFNGSGRLHAPSPFSGIDDYQLVNYTWFPDDGFVRDPERLGPRRDPSRPRGPFTGGFNVPYTYPDLNNLFLAAVKADGTVLTPSYHRPWLFGPLNDLPDPAANKPGNPNWTNTVGKYLLLRPRPCDMGPGFPYPEDAGGDVKNLVGAPGLNDSVWLDLHFPVLSLPDGRQFKPLFAPLIVDLDNRINVNVHGNVRGNDSQGQPAHASHQGWGPWEVSLQAVLSRPAGEGINLFLGTPVPRQLGRYGGNPVTGPPGTPALPPNNVAAPVAMPHFYAQVDYDSCDEQAGYRPSQGLQLPGKTPLSCFPTFAGGFGNGSVVERTDHPLLYNFAQPAGDDRAFGIADLVPLLRGGDPAVSPRDSGLWRLCPQNFSDKRIRRLVTTHSFDRRSPGAAPWLYDPTQSGYQSAPPDQAPAGPPLSSPPLALRSIPPPLGSEFGLDWRSNLPRFQHLNVNRALAPFPQPPAGAPDRYDDEATADQFLNALFERQQFAEDLYRALLAVTGVAPAANPLAPTDDELRPRRWLAQLAVNIVDFVDEDDIQTPFNFYTESDAYPQGRPDGAPPFDVGAVNGDAELPRYWVFGVELPHVVLNEVLAEYREPDQPMPGSTYDVGVWLELHNPFQVPPAGQELQPRDGLPVSLYVPALAPGQSASASGNDKGFAPYQVVVANRLRPRPGDNVLGKPDEVRGATTDADFTSGVFTVGGNRQAPPPAGVTEPYLDLAGGATGNAFFLIGSPGMDAHGAIAAPPAGTVPATTPLLQTPALRYTVTYGPGTPPPRSPDDRDTGVTVLLRRLTNPHIPFDPRPAVMLPDGEVAVNLWYNPYLTVDYLDQVPLRNAADPAAEYASRGKRQPYAAHLSQVADQAAAGRTQHTFGQPNGPVPVSGRYDWLVHLDRPPINPMELLHVAGCAPHQLTQRFLTGDAADQHFTHLAPWFDSSRRLYRLFEFLDIPDRVARGDTGVSGRVAGKVNLNTIWDPETLLALCDPQPANAFTAADVAGIYNRLLALRTPGGVPGADDRPFRSLATGFTAPGDTQYPQGSGIDDTLLRSFEGGARRLFEPDLPAGDPRQHPYLRHQLLTKLFGNFTPRSNVFAVWLTVGFFEVTDDTARPVKLGREIGLSNARFARHRLFAIVDRSVLDNNPRPMPHFDPRKDAAVLYLSVID